MGKESDRMDSDAKPAKEDRWDQLFNRLIDGSVLRGEFPLKNFLSYVELNLLILALQKCKGNQRKAAKILGIKNTTLHEKMKKYSLGLRKVLVFDEERQN